jgi:hypothetical protein
MSNLLASLLSGFGFQAFVVCGWVERSVAERDRSKDAAVHNLSTEEEVKCPVT